MYLILYIRCQQVIIVQGIFCSHTFAPKWPQTDPIFSSEQF